MITLDDLTPSEFENLTYDLVVAGGLRSVTWRTPGSDGGRDIEAYHDTVDWTGEFVTSKWYIECKKYSKSLSWPLIWEKIAHADSHQANFLLISTNNNPSPACETEIRDWNRIGRSPKIRVWRGYDFATLLSTYEAVAQKYGLGSPNPIIAAEPLIALLLKISNSNQSALAFGSDTESGIEAAAAIAELVSMRIDHINHAGKFLRGSAMVSWPEWSWIKRSQPSFIAPDDIGFRAIVTYLYHILRPEGITIEPVGTSINIKIEGARFSLNDQVRRGATSIANWSDFEIEGIPDSTLVKIAHRG